MNALNVKTELIEKNYPLVLWMVKRHRNRAISFDDQIQAGVFGLVVAANRFDPSIGAKFSSYASFWIIQKLNLQVIKQPPSMQSLDEPLFDSSDLTLGDLIPDSFLSPHEKSELSELKARVRLALKVLSPQQRKVIELKFGLLDVNGKEKTFREISDIFGLTRQRCHQIYQDALNRLRPEFSRFDYL